PPPPPPPEDRRTLVRPSEAFEGLSRTITPGGRPLRLSAIISVGMVWRGPLAKVGDSHRVASPDKVQWPPARSTSTKTSKKESIWKAGGGVEGDRLIRIGLVIRRFEPESG